jgi:hypothetical protein
MSAPHGAIPFKSWRMMGREGWRRATVLNPSRLNVEAVPVNTFDVLPGCAMSTGQASSAGAFGTLRGFQCLDDQSRHNASPAVPAPDIETRNGPSRDAVDRFESLLAVESGQVLSRSQLTPANGALAVKRQQARRWTLLHDSAECALVLLSRSLVIFGADSPIHAPAPIAGAALAEKSLKGGPQRWRQRSDGELHCAYVVVLGQNLERQSRFHARLLADYITSDFSLPLL